jgi:2-polyprenyl-3-methyl-5-hydroxy-6-metoxy-1,4-benzoquinol methylase
MIRDEREPIILDLVAGKDVLDVGCVEHLATRAATEEWLHKKLYARARSVLGLDLAEPEVKKLAGRYNIVVGDAHSVDLHRDFDCVVAGELIEHLDNPGMFLRNMLRHLRPGGQIILTTPNPFYPKRLLEVLTRGGTEINDEHTCWYCDVTLTQLLRRVGFEEVRTHFVSNSVALLGLGRLPRLVRRRFSDHILVVGQKPRAPVPEG